jgi:hypothetical protein
MEGGTKRKEPPATAAAQAEDDKKVIKSESNGSDSEFEDEWMDFEPDAHVVWYEPKSDNKTDASVEYAEAEEPIASESIASDEASGNDEYEDYLSEDYIETWLLQVPSPNNVLVSAEEQAYSAFLEAQTALDKSIRDVNEARSATQAYFAREALERAKATRERRHRDLAEAQAALQKEQDRLALEAENNKHGAIIRDEQTAESRIRKIIVWNTDVFVTVPLREWKTCFTRGSCPSCYATGHLGYMCPTCEQFYRVRVNKKFTNGKIRVVNPNLLRKAFHRFHKKEEHVYADAVPMESEPPPVIGPSFSPDPLTRELPKITRG